MEKPFFTGEGYTYKSLNHYIFKNHGKALAMFFVGSLILLFSLFIFVSEVFVMIIPIWLILLPLRYIYLYNKALSAFMKNFAEVHGYTFSESGDISTLEATLSEVGHTKSMRHVVEGMFEDHPFKLFNYSFTIGFGKHKQVYRTTIFELDLEKNVPHMILTSRSFWNTVSYHMRTSNTETTDAGSIVNPRNLKHLQLEGNFNHYFNLYVTPELEIESLEIFTPDIMVHMIDYIPGCNVEFIDDKVYIIAGKQITKEKDLHSIYTLAQTLSRHMDVLLDRKKENWFQV